MNIITFYKPIKTLSISLTGKQCELQCSHCNSQSLKHMSDIHTANKSENFSNYNSLLISGGSNKQGSLNLEDKISDLEVFVKSQLNLNIHTGLATSQTLNVLKKLLKLANSKQNISISFDFLAHTQTIKDVYNIPKTKEDYLHSLLALKTLEAKESDTTSPNAIIIPHVCIGLWGGKIFGEFEALDILHSIGFKKIIFIVFKPTLNTNFENKCPPNLNEVKKVFQKGIDLFGFEKIQLGCMRPTGKYRDNLDNMAIEVGIRHIVMPSKLAIKKAKEMNLNINYKHECCVF